MAERFCLASDGDHRWHLIPARRAEEWSERVDRFWDGDEEALDVDWAPEVAGPESVTFENPRRGRSA